jgi:hypothetical protein
MASPQDIVRNAGSGSSVVGWKLDRGQRAALLERLEPRYDNVVADHVTLAAKVARDAELPDAVSAEAVGHIDDDQGVEALVVAIDGTTDRPDGSTYHITWSLGPGRRAKESNDALANGPWQPLREPIPLTLTPARWP